MEEQLSLIQENRPSWYLDEKTKAIGREGIRQARAAIESARRYEDIINTAA